MDGRTLLLAGAVPASPRETRGTSAWWEEVVLDTFLRHVEVQLRHRRERGANRRTVARREVGRRGCSVAESVTAPPDLVADLRGSGDPWRAPADPMRAVGASVAPTRARRDRGGGGGGGVNQAARALRLVAEEVNASHNTRTKLHHERRQTRQGSCSCSSGSSDDTSCYSAAWAVASWTACVLVAAGSFALARRALGR